MVQEGNEEFTECLDDSRSTFFGVFARLVIFPKVRITRLLCDNGRLEDGWWRDESRLAGVYASKPAFVGR